MAIVSAATLRAGQSAGFTALEMLTRLPKKAGDTEFAHELADAMQTTATAVRATVPPRAEPVVLLYGRPTQPRPNERIADGIVAYADAIRDSSVTSPNTSLQASDQVLAGVREILSGLRRAPDNI